MSVVKCISGSGYRDTAAVQLFEGPAPTVEPVASRVDRLKAIGNGQVPQCAAEAWRLLTCA